MRQLLQSVKKSIYLVLFFSMNMSIVYAQQSALDVAQQLMPALSKADRTLVETEPPVMPPSPALILKRVVEAENKFRETLNQYTFKREVILQTIGIDGQVNGEYIRQSEFVFSDRGERIERVLYYPKSNLKDLKITREDIQDLAGSQLFGFDATTLDLYRLTFTGKQMLGAQETYVFEVGTKAAPNPYRMRERFFVGRIWVDPQSFQIIKVRGKTEPQGKQRFPVFETLRGQMGGPSLFPTSTFADDILRFPKLDIHYRVIVKYSNYRRFRSTVTLTEIE